MRNILILSAGRRVSLVKEFLQVANEFGKDIKIFTADKEPSMASACYISDGYYQLRSVNEDGYIDELLEICKTNSIEIVVPTIDTCLPIISENKCFFEEYGIQIMVAEPFFVDNCCDKRKTFNFFAEHGLRHPQLINIENPTFPMFAKPFDGSGSKGLYAIISKEDLSESIRCNPKLMFMEYIDKKEYKEFTVDMYYGRDNRIKCIVPRERLEVRSGEVSKAITRNNYLVDFLKERFEYLPGVVGTICIQLFYRQCDNDVIGIEINPRFGGGYPLSYNAGANFPKMILEEYLYGKQLEYDDDWRSDLLMLRYAAEIIL